MEALAKFYQTRAAEFLKTVVCFDDQAYEKTHGSTALTANRPDSGFGDENPEEENFTTEEEELDDSSTTHRLDERRLTDAFAEKGILCSVIKTENTARAVERQILAMSKSADIMLLDWQLENLEAKDKNTLVGDVVYKILQEDEKAGGRLRLIVIFSGEKEKGVLDVLSKKLEDLHFTHHSDTDQITKDATKIVFIGKPGGESSDRFKLGSYAELPDKVIEYFTSLVSGILPVTAVSAISAIREQTHHLLARFPAELDSALIAHKCLIPDPDDAAPYLISLISDAISVLVSQQEVSEALSPEVVGLWLEERLKHKKDELSWMKPITREYEPDKIKLIKEKGKKSLKKNAIKKTVLDTLSVNHENHKKMSILTKVMRYCDSGLPNTAPNLTLGVVVETAEGQYLLCIQPLCDAVRIKVGSPRKFPFLPLTRIPDLSSENTLPASPPDLCLPDRDSKAWCKVDKHPMHLVVHRFNGGQSGCVESKEKVIDQKTGETRFFFDLAGGEGDKPQSLRWVADLKIPFVQRISSGLAERLHTLGVDDYEVLRAR